MPKKIHPHYITPAQYAIEIGVNRKTVYNHIKLGKIEVILVGMKEDAYIDFKKYRNHPFELSHRRKSTL